MLCGRELIGEKWCDKCMNKYIVEGKYERALRAHII